MKRTWIEVMGVFGLFLCLLAAVARPQPASPQKDQADFNRLVDEFFDDHFRHSPTAATAAGVHDFDNQLEDYSQAEVEARIVGFKRFAALFDRIDPNRLERDTAGDRELVMSHIRAKLLELEVTRPWEKEPDRYGSGITQSVFVIMSRKFASAEDRLRSVVARERQMPRVFDHARRNLKNPPRIYTEIALEQLPGMIGFFHDDVPAAFADVGDKQLLAEFQDANQAVIDALAAYEGFLKNDLLPRSNGDFRLGADHYRQKLLYEELVDIPLDRLLEIGSRDLRANQESFQRTAAKLDPQRQPAEILADLERDHPAPDQLLESFRQVLEGLRQFITEHKIVTIPSQVPPLVRETPPFMRALSFASMDTPGPFET
ncbi:MAG: DUF885 family protein, partial [Planctomycetes bacterium]|nr:DUF885 family protein [Planctomycetota bacterium]